jgi:outer membrane protein assembly factor BamB
LIFTSSGAEASVWVVNQAKPPVQAARIEGRLVASGDQLFVYNLTGLYRLSPDLRSVTLLYPLPRAYTDLDDAVALPDDGLLLAHVDPADARLIALNADGTLRWQRSYVPAIRAQSVAQARPRLVTTGNRVYLLLQNNVSTSSITDIFSVGLDDGALTRIFTGGTRNLAQEDVWALAVDGDLVLVNYGGSVVALMSGRRSRLRNRLTGESRHLWQTRTR